MINLKTGAISVPGILSNLLYKDIAQGLNSYGGYSDNSMAGPQTPDSFTVDRDTLDKQIGEIGAEYGKGLYGLAQDAVKGLATIGTAVTMGPNMAGMVSNAIDVNAGKVPGNTTGIGKFGESLSKIANNDFSLSDITSAIGYAATNPANPLASITSQALNALTTGYKGLSALADIAGLSDESGITASGKQGLSNAINNAISSGFSGPNMGGRPASQLDTFGLEDMDISPTAKADAIAGRGDSDSSGSSSSSGGLGSDSGSSDRGSSRGMGGVSGRGGEDSDEGSAGAGW